MKRIALVLSLVLNGVLILAIIGGLWGAVSLMQSFGEWNYERRQTLFEELEPAGGILFIGDSITEGAEWSELFGRPDVWNRGIGGDTTAGVLRRMDSLVAIQPRQVFLMIGVNDLNQGVGRKETLGSYQAILAALERELPDAELVVQSVLPVGEGWTFTSNDDIRSLNEELRSLARDHRYVDLHALFADETGALPDRFTNDGIHLLGPAYARWRDHVEPLLAP